MYSKSFFDFFTVYLIYNLTKILGKYLKNAFTQAEKAFFTIYSMYIISLLLIYVNSYAE